MANDQQSNSKNSSWIAGLIVSCGVAVCFFGVWNYSLNESFWSFSLLQVIGIFIQSIAGGLIAYSIYTKNLQRIIFFINTYAVILGAYLIIFGIQVINKKEMVFRFIQFRGDDAVYHGKISIGLGIFIIITSLFTKIKTSTSKTPDVVMCRNCLVPLSASSKTELTCQECGGILEDVKNNEPNPKGCTCPKTLR
jgi:hypothetical protein